MRATLEDIEYECNRIAYCLDRVLGDESHSESDDDIALHCKKILESDFKDTIRNFPIKKLLDLLIQNIEKFHSTQIGMTGKLLRASTIEDLFMSFYFAISEEFSRKVKQEELDYNYQETDLSFVRYVHLYNYCGEQIDIVASKIESLISSKTSLDNNEFQSICLGPTLNKMFLFIEERELEVRMEHSTSFEDNFHLTLTLEDLNSFEKFIEAGLEETSDKEAFFYRTMAKLNNFSKIIQENTVVHIPEKLYKFQSFCEESNSAIKTRLPNLPLENYFDSLTRIYESKFEVSCNAKSRLVNISKYCGTGEYEIINKSLSHLKEKELLKIEYYSIVNFIESTFQQNIEKEKKNIQFEWSDHFDEKNLVLLFDLWIKELKITNKSAFSRAMINNLNLRMNHETLYSYLKGKGKRPSNNYKLQVDINQIVSQTRH